MEVIDLIAGENQEQESKKPADEKSGEIKSAKKDNERLIELKNAHATGDGSFGRSESSLPDDEAQKKQGNSNY